MPELDPQLVKAAYARIAADDATRPALHDLLDYCGLLGSSSDGYREGQRAVARHLKDMLDEADPRIFPRLLAEQANDELHRRAVEGG